MTQFEPWTPASVREIAQALFGPTWQARLADAIAEATGLQFPTVRVRHWYLSKNGRPIPAWLQGKLTPIFMDALLAHDRARTVAIRELTPRRGDMPWPMGHRGANVAGSD